MKVLDSENQIKKKVIEALKNRHRKTFVEKVNSQYKGFIEKSREIINKNIRSSKTYKSLQSGILKRDFGIDDVTFAIFDRSVSDIYNCSFTINESPKDKNTIISLTFDVSELEEGNARIESIISATSYESPRSGETIEWLRWLLYRKGAIINKKWKVLPKDGAGRSKMGVMITCYKQIDKNGNPKEDYTFTVSRSYSGKYGDNFVSKAIRDSLEEIKSILPVSKK